MCGTCIAISFGSYKEHYEFITENAGSKILVIPLESLDWLPYCCAHPVRRGWLCGVLGEGQQYKPEAKFLDRWQICNKGLLTGKQKSMEGSLGWRCSVYIKTVNTIWKQ